VTEVFRDYFFKASLLSVTPRIIENGDRVVFADQLEVLLENSYTEAIVIRTLPNNADKKHANYSGTNPCYFDIGVVDLLDQLETKHFLVDTPSVDREEDAGVLAFHHAFWKYPEQPRRDRTITEMVFIDGSITDGEYMMELQIANFCNDASPSRPLLYRVQEKKG